MFLVNSDAFVDKADLAYIQALGAEYNLTLSYLFILFPFSMCIRYI